MPVREAWVIEAVRTPFGRRGGALSTWHPIDLLAGIFTELLVRAGADPSAVEDVIVGCGAQVGAQAGNIARRAALAAGWPDTVPGVTVERQAASSAQAVQWAAQGVAAGTHDLVVAGGVDVMSAVPPGANLAVPSVGKPFGQRLSARYRDGGGLVPPGQAAESVASHFDLDRRLLDEWALGSIEKAKRAKGADHVVAVPSGTGSGRALKVDEALTGAPNAKALRSLLPLFEVDGRITAANMAAEADGAAAVLVAAPATARRLGLVPKARFVSLASGGGDPGLWPVANVGATVRALRAARTQLADIDRYEIFESSSAAVLGWASLTGADRHKLNPEGGSLAFGAPLGAVGAALFAGVVGALARGEAATALVSVAGDGGVGTACVLATP